MSVFFVARSGILAAVFLAVSLTLTATAQQQPEDPPPFDDWLSELRAEAVDQGIRTATIRAALDGLEPNDRVIELDRRQPEFTQTFSEYLSARVSEARIARGREMMALNRDTLREVAAEYDVQPRFIAAIWGLETNYGGYTGGMSVIRSLATLAWDRRRSDYFRRELISALKIIDAGHVKADSMLGSWAGAMGQSQFMPSSFLDYAQDYDKDGRRDIWTTEADVFASIAHYLARYGWRDDMTWGRRVLLPAGMVAKSGDLAQESPPQGCSRALREHSRALPLDQWQARGVRRMTGTALPERDFEASLYQPEDADGPAYLTYSNYRAILRYNCSNLYAMAVGHLADALRDWE